jgi:hypothetical protein
MGKRGGLEVVLTVCFYINETDRKNYHGSGEAVLFILLQPPSSVVSMQSGESSEISPSQSLPKSIGFKEGNMGLNNDEAVLPACCYRNENGWKKRSPAARTPPGAISTGHFLRK